MKRRWTRILVGAGIALLLALIVVVPIVLASTYNVHSSQQPIATRTITAQGHGSIRVVPDQASVVLGVQSRNATVGLALSSNSDKVNAIIAALKDAGVPVSDIQTADLSIWFDTQYREYVLTNNVAVRIDGVDRVGRILERAVAAGANASWGISFGVKDSSSARSKALHAALVDARKRASSIAGGLGFHITGVRSATEATYGNASISQTGGMGGGGAPPIQGGQLAVTADVTVTYTAR